MTIAPESGIDLAGRIQMFITSFQVSIDYFPFGSSLGTFGGSVASLFYSPLYYEYGISEIIGFYPPEYQLSGFNFLSDFKWTHIIAEFGLISSSIFFIIYFFPLVKFYYNKIYRIYPHHYFLTASLSILLFVEGFGSSIPENLAFTSLSFFLIFTPHYFATSKS